MDTNSKKISFGFSKAIKKSNLIKPIVKHEKQIQLIDCLEEQCIKVIGEEKTEKQNLIIPLKRKEISVNEKLVSNIKSNDPVDELKLSSGHSEPLPTLDELAAQELLSDIKNSKTKNEDKKVFSINLIENKNLLEGEKESTIEDYENIPVHDFGLAMLRGMGWEEGKGLGKNKKVISTSVPVVRPKGMGLGADKVVKLEPPNIVNDEKNEDLQIIKGTYVKMLAGRFKDTYGQIEGLDDESGRLIIKMTLDGNNISVNEFVVKPVTKDEYNKNSRVINSAKYEEYKKRTETMNNSYIVKENDQNLKKTSQYGENNKNAEPQTELMSRSKESNIKSKSYSCNKELSTGYRNSNERKDSKYSKKSEDSFSKYKNTSQYTSSRNTDYKSNYSNKSKESKAEILVISSSDSETEKYVEKRSSHRHFTKKDNDETSSSDGSDRNERKHKHKKQKKKKHSHHSKSKNEMNEDKKYNSSKKKHRHRSRSRTRS